MQIRTGESRVVIAGGMESMSNAPYILRGARAGYRMGDGVLEDMMIGDGLTCAICDCHMGVHGGNVSDEEGVGRQEQDAWALRSHQRAVQAIDEGRFVDEIVPLKVTARDGSVSVFDTDEHPRRETSREKLASLKVLHPEIEGFSVTAGNSSGINDAASAVVVASADLAADQGLAPLATIRSWASVGVDPVETGLAPVPAIRKALDRAGLTTADVDLWEINEAFASVPIAAVRLLGLDEDIVNVSGSGCSLGHPVAATGARIVATLIYELRRRGGGTAVAAMCAGGGMASALVLTV
jgi:acetyl-CoA C-acetyltransferase